MSNFDPLTGDPLPKSNNTESQPREKPAESVDPSRLDGMTKPELIALIKLVCGARWGEIALLSEEEAYNATMLKLLHGGLTAADIGRALPPLKEWADRA